MKVGIVGSGFVGATAGYALVMQGVGREIVLVDKNTARAAAEADDLRHAVPFVHVEGPSISPADGPRGAHPAEHVRAPSPDEFERWQQASGNLVGMVTLAPEHDGAAAYIAANVGSIVRLTDLFLVVVAAAVAWRLTAPRRGAAPAPAPDRGSP